MKYSWYTILFLFQVYIIVIQQLYTLWNSHHNNCSYPLSPYKDITVLLTIDSMLSFAFLWFSYFITGSLYLFIPFAYFCLFSCFPSLWQPPDKPYHNRSLSLLLWSFIFTKLSKIVYRGSSQWCQRIHIFGEFIFVVTQLVVFLVCWFGESCKLVGKTLWVIPLLKFYHVLIKISFSIKKCLWRIWESL